MAKAISAEDAPPLPALPRRQGRGRRLTDRERMEIIELTRANPGIKHVALAARYGVNETTIRKWRRAANSAKIESRYSAGVAQVRDHRQREQAVRNAAFDAVMLDWVRAQRAARAELSPGAVRAKARKLAAAYDDMRGFKASSGWYYRFCRRNAVSCPSSARDVAPSSALTTTISTTTTVEVDTAPASLAPASLAPASIVTTGPEKEETQEKNSGEDRNAAHHSARDALGPAEDDNGAARREQSASVEVTAAGKRKLGDAADEGSDRMRQQRRGCESPVRTLPAPSLPPTPDPSQTLVFDSPATPITQPPLAPVAALVAPAPIPTPVVRVPSVTLATPAAATTAATPATPAASSAATPAATTTPATPVAPLVTLAPASTTPAASPPTPATPVTPATPAALFSPPPPQLTSPPMSTRQEAISHFLLHHKSLMSLPCRLRFIKHLAHANEDAEMYTVMDDETRVEYIKEFVEADRAERSAAAGGGASMS